MGVGGRLGWGFPICPFLVQVSFWKSVGIVVLLGGRCLGFVWVAVGLGRGLCWYVFAFLGKVFDVVFLLCWFVCGRIYGCNWNLRWMVYNYLERLVVTVYGCLSYEIVLEVFLVFLILYGKCDEVYLCAWYHVVTGGRIAGRHLS